MNRKKNNVILHVRMNAKYVIADTDLFLHLI
jgi:hypothetical protein